MKLATKIFKRDDWYVTSSFGNRKPIKTKKGTTGVFHFGCDYGTNCEKWPQYAIENGIIISSGIANDGAKYIWVGYPRINKKLLHSHLDSICVKKGQKVEEGTLLGYTGATGMATGIHLHLGMKNINGGGYQDPHQYDYQIEKFTNINTNKSVDELAIEVIRGDWGNGKERINRLTKAGYNAKEIQNKVNIMLNDNHKISEKNI